MLQNDDFWDKDLDNNVHVVYGEEKYTLFYMYLNKLTEEGKYVDS